MRELVREIEENETIARQLIDVEYGEKDLDAIDELVTEEFVEHRRDLHGHEAFKAYVQSIPEWASDHTVSSDLQIANEDCVVARWTATGTNDGPLMGAEPTGNQFEFTGMSLYRIDDGRIAEAWAYWDSMQLYEQLELPVTR